MTDPFTLAYRALWSMMSERSDFADLVRIGNRIDFANDANRNPVKQVAAAADLPEIILVPAGCSVNIHNTSSSSRVIRRYTWLMSTGDARVSHLLFPVEWAVLRGMTNWKTVMGALEWRDKRFVKRCDVISVTEGDSDPARNRGIKGWSAAWACEVEMHFDTSDLTDLDDDLGSGSEGSGS